MKIADLYLALLDALPDPVVLADMQGQLVKANKAACDLLGYDREALERMQVEDLIPSEMRAGHERLRAGFVAGRFSRRMGVGKIFPVLCADGSHLPVEISIGTATAALTGEPLLAVTLADRSEYMRMQAERDANLAATLQANQELASLNERLETTYGHLIQSEKMAAVGQLSAGIAHELNNPIGFVSSNLAMLGRYATGLLDLLSLQERIAAHPGDAGLEDELKQRRAELDPEYLRDDLPDLIADTTTGLQRVVKIIRDLVSFASTDEVDDWRQVDINQALDETLSVMQPLIGDGCEIRREYGHLPPVLCQHSEINQVFLGLLNNALEAIDGPGVITLRTEVSDGFVNISIADTGRGIAPENLRRIFNPFFTTRPVGSGMGLGLSMVYGIVQRHHGNVTVTSTPGQGATFTVTLPVQQAGAERGSELPAVESPETAAAGTQERGVPSVPPAGTTVPAGKKPHVLVVDDNDSWLRMMQLFLQDNYRVTLATTGAEAIRLVEKAPFDLILLDRMMPGMDGLETMARLKGLDNFADTPVVMVTADASPEKESDALSLGICDFISKTTRLSLIGLRIGNLLQRSKMASDLRLVLTSGDQGYWEKNAESGNIVITDYDKSSNRQAGDWRRREFAEWATICHPEDRARLAEAEHGYYVLGRSPALDVDIRLMDGNGEWQWYNLYGVSDSRSATGKRNSIRGVFRNIHERRQSEQRIRESEELLGHVMAATGDGIWDWRIAEDRVKHNAAWCRMLGLDARALQHPVGFYMGLIHPEDAPQVELALTKSLGGDAEFTIEYRLRHADGHYFWVLDRGKVVERGEDGAPRRMIGAVKDINDKKNRESELVHMALHDPLTGLPNRKLLMDRLQQSMHGNRRNKTMGALLFIDMDRFKQLNDTLGHDYGDMMLIEIAKRLLANTRMTDTVCRLGGDEFIILLTGLPSKPEDAKRQAARFGDNLLFELNKPYPLGEVMYSSTPSIGATLFEDAEYDLDQVIKRADNAMYRAKDSGRNCLRFDAE